MQDAVLSVLRMWSERGYVTTAHVERDHKANKDNMSGGKSSVRPTVEAGVYKTHCIALMRSHVGRGRRDFSKRENQHILAARRSGVPLRKDRLKRQQQSQPLLRANNRLGNVRWRFQNAQVRSARAQRGRSFTEAERRQEFVAAGRAFDAKSRDDRDEWVRTRVPLLPPQPVNDFAALHPGPAMEERRSLLGVMLAGMRVDGEVADDEAGVQVDVVGRQSRHPHLDFGTEFWPIDPRALLQYYAEQGGHALGAGVRMGFASASRTEALRDQLRTWMVVREPSQHVPRGKVLVEVPCQELPSVVGKIFGVVGEKHTNKKTHKKNRSCTQACVRRNMLRDTTWRCAWHRFCTSASQRHTWAPSVSSSASLGCDRARSVSQRFAAWRTFATASRPW